MPIVGAATSEHAVTSEIKPTRVDFELYHGDTFEVILTLGGVSGSGVPLISFTPLVQIRNAAGTVVATPTVDLDYEGVPGAVHILLLDTSSFPAGSYKYDFQLSDDSGRKKTYISGTINFTQDVSE